MSRCFRAAFLKKQYPASRRVLLFTGEERWVLVRLCYSFLVKQMIRFASSKPAAR